MEAIAISQAVKKLTPPQLEAISRMKTLYSHIELSDDEIELVILEAKAKKFFDLQDEAKKNTLEARRMESKKPWTFQQQKNYAYKKAVELSHETGKQHQHDAEYVRVFNLLAQYFTNDILFEKNAGFSLTKGILLMGNGGVGKTDMLKAFSLNKKMCYEFVTSKKIRDDVKDLGENFWKAYTTFVPSAGGREEYFFQNTVGWLVDDFGQEEIITDYGNKIDAIANIITKRYDMKGSVPFFSLHMTTNLNADMIEARYGYPFRSRLRDMFNIIEYKGMDRRV